MMLSEERHFFAVSLTRNIDALWDSSAAWSFFCNQLYDGWPSFSFAEQSLVYEGLLPLPQHSQNLQRFDARERCHFFFDGIVGLFLLGTGTAVDCSHKSLRDGGSCKSGTDSRRALASLLLVASSSSWSTFYRSWLAGDLTRSQLLEYATFGIVDEYLRGIAANILDSLAPLSVSVSPTVSAPPRLHLRGS